MGWLEDVINTLGEGAVAQRYGPDFVLKARMAREKAAQDQAITAARLKEVGLDTEAKTLGLEEARTKIGRQRKVEEELSRLAGAGALPSEYPEVSQALAEQTKSKRDEARAAQEAAKASREAELFPTVKAQGEAELKNTQNKFAHDLALARERASMGAGGYMIGPTVMVEDPNNPGRTIVLDRRSGQQVGTKAPTFQEQQGASLEQSISETVRRMNELANSPEMVTGPIAGRFSRLKKSVMGPEGARDVNYEFDALGKQAVDLVYKKSGKQINQTEMRVLEGLIPSRSRGNLPEQARLFTQYADTLLKKYSGPAPNPVAPSGGGLKVLSIEKVQ